MSQGFALGSEGDMRREWWRSVIHSNLDQVWRLWEGFWAIYSSRAKCHCISFFLRIYNPLFKSSLEDGEPSGKEVAVHAPTQIPTQIPTQTPTLHV